MPPASYSKIEFLALPSSLPSFPHLGLSGSVGCFHIHLGPILVYSWPSALLLLRGWADVHFVHCPETSSQISSYMKCSYKSIGFFFFFILCSGHIYNVILDFFYFQTNSWSMSKSCTSVLSKVQNLLLLAICPATSLVETSLPSTDAGILWFGAIIEWNKVTWT